MPVDYHIHTKMCGHAYGEMEEYVAAAQRKGLREIGFADHVPMYFLAPEQRDLSIAMKEEELPLYVEQVREMQAKFHPFNVKLGLEADFTPGMENELAAILEAYDFDYVLGSIHYIDGWGYDNSQYISEYDKWDLYELYRRYFTILGQAAASGLFDTLAHPDLIKKFGFSPQADIAPLYAGAVQKIAEAGVCIEVNTAGLRAPAGEIYPQIKFLELCRKNRVPVTLGSDAHHPEQVGAGFKEAMELLRTVGYREVVTFSGRKRNYLMI